MLPAQERVELRALVEFKDAPNLRYRTPSTKNLTIQPHAGQRVRQFTSGDLPHPFWSRDDKVKECTIQIDVDPKEITAAELHVIAWTGGAGRRCRLLSL